jgi:hypothetical protein
MGAVMGCDWRRSKLGLWRIIKVPLEGKADSLVVGEVSSGIGERMRIKDIKVGEEYKICYGIRGKVLATAVANTSFRGTTRNDGVQVEVLGPASRAGQVLVYASRDVKELWSVHAESVRARELQNRYREEIIAEREQRVNGMGSQMRQLGVEIDSLSFSRWGDLEGDNFQVTVQIGSDKLERLIAMLGEPEVQQRAAAIPAEKPKSDSALEQVFG